jgi:hypothetical protein
MGCVTVVEYFVSTPAVLPLPLVGKGNDSGAAEIRLVEMKLWLQALDAIPRGDVRAVGPWVRTSRATPPIRSSR